jgi:hypothetical protein
MPRCVLNFAGNGNVGRMDSKSGNVFPQTAWSLFDGLRLCVKILN